MPEQPLSPLEQQILKARLKVQAEMPDVADAPIDPMGWVDQLIAGAKEKLTGGGSIVAMANRSFRPLDPAGMPIQGAKSGRVVYSPEVLGEQSPAGIEDTLAHELVHVRQGREREGGGLFDQVRRYLSSIKEGYLPYGQQPDELEAYQFEGDRAVREGREPTATPKFQLTPEDLRTGRILREKGDYLLTPEKR